MALPRSKLHKIGRTDAECHLLIYVCHHSTCLRLRLISFLFTLFLKLRYWLARHRDAAGGLVLPTFIFKCCPSHSTTGGRIATRIVALKNYYGYKVGELCSSKP